MHLMGDATATEQTATTICFGKTGVIPPVASVPTPINARVGVAGWMPTNIRQAAAPTGVGSGAQTTIERPAAAV
jgi:hypothetical protein